MSDNRHTLPRAPSAERHRMAHPWLTAEGYQGLAAEALRRGTHPDRLAAQILEQVVADHLFDAVIDE